MGRFVLTSWSPELSPKGSRLPPFLWVSESWMDQNRTLSQAISVSGSDQGVPGTNQEATRLYQELSWNCFHSAPVLGVKPSKILTSACLYSLETRFAFSASSTYLKRN